MKISKLVHLIILFCFTSLAYSTDVNYTINDVRELVPKQTSKGWWHKQFSSMSGNKYLSSFQSKEHEGKINWNKEDLEEGKIQIINAMKLARQWCDNNTPFDEKQWEIESVTLRFRTGNNEIEYFYAVTLKTPEYKTIEVIILPNYEIIAPIIDPKF